ncbi:hypothetical protein MED121_05780 [Marinomonas sp. MED121]|uniref:GFA family protein n=1 Tax=Marinomonas sp. MED121 TaxID=314277 RepID=UPI0000690315|nr:GFA family protein [Marinomonas sp. MED121]EAQ66167.1 hypothetical protein MED121_05780 [Marinomonas sp. MED121]
MYASCLCGQVKLVIKTAFISSSICHCQQCQKSHGAASAAYGVALKSEVEWLSGKKRVRKFASSERVRRGFCKDCGTNIYFYHKDHPNHLDIPLAILDTKPNLTPQCHIFVDSKVGWDPILDDLPQHAQSC